MPLKRDVIVENMLEDELNGNTETFTNINHDNDNVSAKSDQYKGENNHKPEYICVDNDRNLNIKCVGADFEVINVLSFPFEN